MKDRIKKSSLLQAVGNIEEASSLIQNNMTIAMSGYAMSGYPKAIVEALIARRLAGEDLTIHLITGANVPWLDEKLGTAQILARRTPMCANRALAAQINAGSVYYAEQQMNKFPRLLRSGSLGKIDVAVVEALGFDEEGNLIPTNSIGMTHHLMDAADAIIVEINTAQPDKLQDLHDVYIPLPPPKTQAIPLLRVNQRIGRTSIPVDSNKIKYIVETHIPERIAPPLKNPLEAKQIAAHLFDFLELKVQQTDGRLPPLQTGFGTIANSIADAFQDSHFNDIQFFCGGIGVSVMELLASGKASALSTGGLEMSERVEDILKKVPSLSDHLVIRNGDITNGAEVISRLGLIALNTGVEIDIYGNVNASHIAGSRVVNGIGGGANFAQNAEISIALIPSTAKSGAISNIVPMVSHQDIGEHDVDIVITEHGIVDLRGLDDRERAEAIIKQCSAGAYQEQLMAYWHAAQKTGGGHHPQLPSEAFAWYQRLKEKGSMLES